MNRRGMVEALLALVASFAAPRPLCAQQPAKVSRIGFFGPSPANAPHLVKAFQEGLRELGYVEGQNITIEYRWNADDRDLEAIAADLAAHRPQVIAASINTVILAVQKAAGRIPIVMINSNDPVELGIVASLGRPGGNITGLTRLTPDLIGKNVELLVEAVPSISRMGLIVRTSNPMNDIVVRNATLAAASRNIKLEIAKADSKSELTAAFDAIKASRAQALLVPGDGLFFGNRQRFAELALKNRLPAMFSNTEHVEAGGMMSYSASSVENYRRAAAFIDKILHGANPGDLPVEQPTKFELVINLRTAKAIGVKIPRSVLARADRVIE